jgi:hypothetical protein
LHWGWRVDPDQSFACYVLYIDLPNGQVSFHSPARYAGPDYDGDWDGDRTSEMRILDFADEVASVHVVGHRPAAVGLEVQ